MSERSEKTEDEIRTDLEFVVVLAARAWCYSKGDAESSKRLREAVEAFDDFEEEAESPF